MSLPEPRPQPLGVLPWPAGMLLLPAGTAPDAAAGLVLGRLPEPWPADLRFLRLALDDQTAAAAGSIAGEDPVSRYNRAVLLGGEGVWAGLAADTDGELRALVDTARYSVGEVDSPPELPTDAGGEVAAIVGSARASAALERGSEQEAVEELRTAAAAAHTAGSPVLAASLRLTLAELLREGGEPQAAAEQADLALRALPPTADRELRAQLQLTRALARQETAGENRAALHLVVADLSEAVKVFTEATHPELFAACNQHLALAYLMMPMGDDADRLRRGVAVTSLRAALRVYRPETHPVAWASTQLNLANALQYLPSVHQEQNLDESVQLYEEVLAYRDPQRDPVGVGRLLSNQANALGHLGVFSDARARLQQAIELFTQAGDADALATARELLAEVETAAAAAGQRGRG